MAIQASFSLLTYLLSRHAGQIRHICQQINVVLLLQFLTFVVVVISGMQLLRLRSAIRQHHPPQRAVLSQNLLFRGA